MDVREDEPEAVPSGGLEERFWSGRPEGDPARPASSMRLPWTFWGALVCAGGTVDTFSRAQ